MTTDKKIQDIAVASIRRHSIHPEEWIHTHTAALHPELNNLFALEPDELLIASAFFSRNNWYVFITRRITACRDGNLLALNPTQGLDCHFGNFKGYPIGSSASTAPIYTPKYWQKKRPTPDRSR